MKNSNIYAGYRYPAAKKELVPSVEHSTAQYENNGCELSDQPTRQQERQKANEEV